MVILTLPASGPVGETSYRRANGTVPAVIEIRDEEGRRCTGSYLQRDVILTAAHCLEHSRPDQLEVGQGNRIRRGKRFLRDPRFISGTGDAPSAYDVGLIELRGSAVGDVAPLSMRRTPLRARERVTVVGRGSRADPQGPLVRTSTDIFMPGNAASPSGVEDTVAGAARLHGLLYLEGGRGELGPNAFGATVVPGDSGGPLLGSDGEISGVVVASSRLDGAQQPHSVTWAVDVAAVALGVVQDFAPHILAPPEGVTPDEAGRDSVVF